MKRKKLSKLVALAAALTLALSVGMVAFAADSPTSNDVFTDYTSNDGIVVVGREGIIDTTTVSGQEASKALTGSSAEVQQKVIAILKNQGIDVTSANVLWYGDVDAYYTNGTGQADTSKGVVVKIPDTGAKAGDVVYLLHWKEDGTIEVLRATVNADGSVTATLTSLSPVAVLKVTLAANGSATVTSVNTTATSPKTGK